MDSILPEETAGRADIPGGADRRMYVLTNCLNLYGAGCILYEGVLEKEAERLKSGFYVLPSSVNEVIIVPAGRILQGS